MLSRRSAWRLLVSSPKGAGNCHARGCHVSGAVVPALLPEGRGRTPVLLGMWRASGAAPSGHELRKTVTVVFCDLVDSTALSERLDAEALRHRLGRYYAEMRAVLESHGGLVEKFIGDGL